MRATELFHADGHSAGIFYCGECRVVHTNQNFAEKCCEPKFCTSQDQYHCGKELGKSDYGPICSTCFDQKRREQTDLKLATATLVEDYDGFVYSHVYDGRRDGFFETADSLSEQCADDWDYEKDAAIIAPEFAFCCTSRPPQRHDIGDVLEQMFCDSFEDAADFAVETEPLERALDAFWEANKGVVSYEPDYTRKVRVWAAQAAPEVSA